MSRYRVSLPESRLLATVNAVAASHGASSSLMCCTPQPRRSLRAKHLCRHSTKRNGMSAVVHGYPSTMQDDYQLNMGTLIRQAVRSYPDTEIVHRNSKGEWGRTTYQENFGRIERGAAALAKLGVRVGDRVGVMDWNSLRHYELYWAVPAIGAVFTQLNLRLGTDDLR